MACSAVCQHRHLLSLGVDGEELPPYGIECIDYIDEREGHFEKWKYEGKNNVYGLADVIYLWWKKRTEQVVLIGGVVLPSFLPPPSSFSSASERGSDGGAHTTTTTTLLVCYSTRPRTSHRGTGSFPSATAQLQCRRPSILHIYSTSMPKGYMCF